MRRIKRARKQRAAEAEQRRCATSDSALCMHALGTESCAPGQCSCSLAPFAGADPPAAQADQTAPGPVAPGCVSQHLAHLTYLDRPYTHVLPLISGPANPACLPGRRS